MNHVNVSFFTSWLVSYVLWTGNWSHSPSWTWQLAKNLEGDMTVLVNIDGTKNIYTKKSQFHSTWSVGFSF